jgi:hypothetical protein
VPLPVWGKVGHPGVSTRRATEMDRFDLHERSFVSTISFDAAGKGHQVFHKVACTTCTYFFLRSKVASSKISKISEAAMKVQSGTLERLESL